MVWRSLSKWPKTISTKRKSTAARHGKFAETLTMTFENYNVYLEALQILKDYDVIFFPKLNVQNYFQQKSIESLPGDVKTHLLRLGHAEFLQKLLLQCSKYGGCVVLINEAWSTKRMACCGTINSGVGAKKVVTCHDSFSRVIEMSMEPITFFCLISQGH
jgi:hypothetical protein